MLGANQDMFMRYQESFWNLNKSDPFAQTLKPLKQGIQISTAKKLMKLFFAEICRQWIGKKAITIITQNTHEQPIGQFHISPGDTVAAQRIGSSHHGHDLIVRTDDRHANRNPPLSKMLNQVRATDNKTSRTDRFFKGSVRFGIVHQVGQRPTGRDGTDEHQLTIRTRQPVADKTRVDVAQALNQCTAFFRILKRTLCKQFGADSDQNRLVVFCRNTHALR